MIIMVIKTLFALSLLGLLEEEAKVISSNT
jgi:hypothetical protein